MLIAFRARVINQEKETMALAKEVMAKPSEIPDETRILTNLAYLMGDVTDTLLMDAYCRVERLGYQFKNDTKQKWKYALQATHAAQRAWKRFAEEIYQLDDADQACEDSDWFADIVVLIADRVGDNEKRQEMVKNMLLRLKTECDIYERLNRH